MKNNYQTLVACLMLICGVIQTSWSQNVIKVGSGSYAEYPPLNEAARPYLSGSAGWGDQSQNTTHQLLYVVDTCTRAIPTNKWWTDLLISKFSGELWAYPGVVSAQPYGAYIKFPKTWSADGKVMSPNSELDIKGTSFTPQSALARRWGDWTIDFVMKESDSKYMAVTQARGIPFTWFEFTGITPVISGTASSYFDDAGNAITFPYTGDHFGMVINGDHYGIFAPANTTFSLSGSAITVGFSGTQKFLVVSTMPGVSSMANFYTYAYTIPRDSKVSWSYNANSGTITSNWNLTTENLKGGTQLNTIQGWLPHHYKNTTLGFSFNGITYATPRGTMKCATGTSFSITYKFNGILPTYPSPNDSTLANAYNKTTMKGMIDDYSGKAGYGNDTYWGGKDLTGMGHYMNYAKQTGNTVAYDKIKSNLKNALADWYTFTPGEESHYFTWFGNFKGLVGMNSSYGSEQYNDHHFHYGYFTYASAMLGFEDKDFVAKYGDMAKLLAKDYANWDRTDTRFPFMRYFDIWEGHSYAGGFGSAVDGNGQESSSEAMQSWGGLYMLGVALGDNAMRDAGIFGWTTEARATAEYWFDRDHVTVSPTAGNYDYTKYTSPYCSNITTRGIGWWTWFSGDPIWMHSIQWLPISPLLKYLYEDRNFAKWDYNKMWSTKQTGGWDTDLGNDSGLGNVVLSYLQVSNPDTAAIVFDWLKANNKPCVTDVNTGGISYYTLHSHRSLGEIQWDKYTNIPTSTVYFNSRNNVTSFVVYNPLETEQTCTAYNTAGTVLATFKVPAKKLITYTTAPVLTSIKVSSAAQTVPSGSTLQLNAAGFDQYGASMSPSITWTVSGGGTINASGLFTATTNGTWTVTAKSGSITATKTIKVNAAPVLSKIVVSASSNRVEIGNQLQFSAVAYDQYNDVFNITPTWSVSAGGTIDANGLLITSAFSASSTVTATSGSTSGSATIIVDYPLTNIALGKPVTVFSEENVGTPKAYINDGDPSTRWASANTDPQWAYIDLQAKFNISKVVLKWETAYSSAYTIQVSDDANTWSTAFTQAKGAGSTETILLSTAGRYIRMYSTARATAYGNSLYEFEVYGKIQSNSTPVLSSIVISPALALVKNLQAQTFTAAAFDQFGNTMSITPSWSIIGTGSINATTGVYTPADSTSGNVIVIAKSGLINGQALGVVEAPRKLSKLTIAPKTALSNALPMAVGIPQQFAVTGSDQYGLPYACTPTYSVSGGGSITQDGFFTPTTAGTYQIFVAQGNLKDTCFVTVKNLSQVNVALFKPAYTSSNENPQMTGANAVDGSTSTRWSSAWTSNEWIYVDLQSTYTLNKVVLTWEGAYATKYDLQVSADASTWNTVYTQNTGVGGTENIPLSSQSARYVRVKCNERFLTAYGYSLIEFEVYANSVSSTPQLTALKLSPVVATIDQGTTKQFTASGVDQFGNAIAASINWSASGGGSINASGLYTGSRVGTYQVTATAGSISKSAIINIEAVSGSSNGGLNIPGKIEAESYNSMLGVQTEATTDTGGGLNVGWIDATDYMNYNVTVASAGTYKVDFRVASTSATGSIQLKKGTTSLGTVAVPNTGGWQVWQTVSMNVTLSAGAQTLQVYVPAGGYNLNWINFSNSSNIAVTGVSINPTTATLTTGSTVQLTATVSPSNASNPSVNWSSNNTAVATVSATGLVTSVGSGSATVTATTVDGNKTATCMVTVTGTTCQVNGQSNDYTVQVSNTANPTFTFVPGANITGCAWVLMYPKVNGVDQGAITMTKTGNNFTYTATAAMGATVTWYFTYNYPSTGGQKDNSATPHSLTVGNCSSLKLETLSEDEVTVGKRLVVYPNPLSDDILKVALSGFVAKTVNIQVINSSGLIMKETTVPVNDLQILEDLNLANLPNGIYFVKVVDNTDVLLKKVIINR